MMMMMLKVLKLDVLVSDLMSNSCPLGHAYEKRN